MEHTKNKAIRLIDYLTELALLRSKIVRDISAYQNILWLHEIPQELEYCYTQAWGTNEEFDENIWIEVKNTTNRFWMKFRKYARNGLSGQLLEILKIFPNCFQVSTFR